jgi:hypothetical protein
VRRSIAYDVNLQLQSASPVLEALCLKYCSHNSRS